MRFIVIDKGENIFSIKSDEVEKYMTEATCEGSVAWVIDVLEHKQYFEGEWSDVKEEEAQ